MTYEDRLHALNWISLDSRRQKHTLTFTTKCLFGLIDCHTIKLNTVVNTRHQSILDTARTLALKNTPCHSFPRIWRSLPSHIKNSRWQLPLHPHSPHPHAPRPKNLEIVHFGGQVNAVSVNLPTKNVCHSECQSANWVPHVPPKKMPSLRPS